MSNPTSVEGPLAVYKQYKQTIDRSIAGYVETHAERFAHYTLPPIARRSLELMIEYTKRPGKRLRGALAAMAYDNQIGDHLSGNGQRLAIVMELIQTSALIEDDVTDKSSFRRGEPTAHRLFERFNEHVNERDAEQLAFYTGIITWYIANLVLLDIPEMSANLAKALGYLQRNITLTTFGQLDDIMQEIGHAAIREEIIRKYTLKTSYYTFINPLQAGLALAGVIDEAVYRQVETFGAFAGVAFQTHDDYLGVFGGDETGKPSVDDIREGKLTILTQHTLEHGSAADVKLLKQYLGNPAIDADAMTEVRAILDRSGATMEARRTAQEYAEKAIQALGGIDIWDAAFKDCLAELITYSTTRKS